MAKIGTAKIDINAYDNMPTAMQLFTDREEPQEAFERKLKVISEHLKDGYGVISYYGIGGQGKTTLKNKLIHLLKSDAGFSWRLGNKIDAYHVEFDFGKETIAPDNKTILTRLRNQMKQYGFGFYLFDTALVLYADKIGIDVSADDGYKTFIDSNKWLKNIFKVGGYIPFANSLLSSLQQVDDAFNDIKSQIGEAANKHKYKEKLDMMRSFTADELLVKLPEYFITDMQRINDKIDKPIVIFLDTYEKYVDTLNNEIGANIDEWLWRGEKSLIKQIPGILWVICGREKLTWGEYDELWKEEIPDNPQEALTEEQKNELAEECIEQHSLGDLSKKDTFKFLEKVGINNDEFEEKIYTLTSGVPYYLEICRQQYFQLPLEKRKDINEYGNNINELTVRFLKTMPTYYKDLSYFLAILVSWTTEDAFEIMRASKYLKDINVTRYNEYIKHSFVIKAENDNYYLHETFKDACLNQIKDDEEFVNDINECQKEVYRKRVLSNKDYKYYYLYRFIDCISKQSNIKNDELEEDWKFINETVYYFMDKGLYKRAFELTRLFYSYVYNYHMDDKLLYADVSYTISEVCIKSTEFALAEVFAKDSYEIRKEILGDDDELTSKSMGLLSKCYYYNNKYDQAYDIDRKLYEYYKIKKGDEDPDTLSIQHRLASDLHSLGKEAESFELANEVFEKRRKVLGEEDDDTLKTLGILETNFITMGEWKKAREIQKRITDILKRKYGTYHPLYLNAASRISVYARYIGDYKNALEFDLSAIEIKEKVLGSYHKDSLNTVADVYEDYFGLKRYDEALYTAEMLLTINEKKYGAYDDYTIRSALRISRIFRAMEEYEKALEIDTKAFYIVSKTKSNSELCFECIESLVGDHHGLKDYKRSADLSELVYNLRKGKNGEFQPKTISALQMLANETLCINDEEKALSLYETAFYQNKKIFGMENKDTIECLNQILSILFSFDVAIPNFIDDEIKSFFENHPKKYIGDWIFIISEMSDVYANRFDYEKALEYLDYGKEQLELNKDYIDYLYDDLMNNFNNSINCIKKIQKEESSEA